MLSSVLKSATAIEMNIAVIRAFVGLRKLSIDYKEIQQLLEDLRTRYDKQFDEVYTVLEHLVQPPQPPRNKIGCRRKDEQANEN